MNCLGGSLHRSEPVANRWLLPKKNSDLRRLRRIPDQCDRQYFVDRLDRPKTNPLLCFQRDIVEIFFVSLRNQDFRDSGTQRRQTLLFKAANREHDSPQRDFSGHRDIVADRAIAEKAGQRSHHCDTGAGAIFLDGAARHMNMDIILREQFRIYSKIFGASSD